MRFGLLCTAQADGRELGPETGQGFRDYLDFNVEAEAPQFARNRQFTAAEVGGSQWAG